MKLGVGVSPTTSIVASQTAAVISAGGGGASPTIESIRESRVFAWFSTISTTSQTIANQESSPADGSSQTTYDVQNGSSTGSDSRDATYEAQSGGEYYKQVTSSSNDYLTMQGFKTTTAFTNSLHKDDAQFTLEIGYGKPASATTAGYIVSTAEDSNDTGISIQQYSSEKMNFLLHRGTPGDFGGDYLSSSALPDGFQHILIVINEGVTNGSAFYINNTKTDTFTITYNSPSTGNATYNWTWLASLLDGNTSNPRFGLHQNAGVGFFAAYNKAVSAAEAAILYTNAPARFKN